MSDTSLKNHPHFVFGNFPKTKKTNENESAGLLCQEKTYENEGAGLLCQEKTNENEGAGLLCQDKTDENEIALAVKPTTPHINSPRRKHLWAT